MSYLISHIDVQVASKIVSPHIHKTSLLECSTINRLCGKNIYLKTENLQKTGSFKIRGAINAIKHEIQDNSKDEKTSVVTHSSGNHGQAVARAASIFGIKSYIVMPQNSPSCKKNAVLAYGGNVIECLNNEYSRQEVADKVLKETGGVFIDASQNPNVIAGQGTIAMEILEENSDIDAIVVPVGGGGLISGIAIAAKSIKPSIRIYAAEPEEAKSCYMSKKNNKLTKNLKNPNTVADGVKVSIGKNTWPIIRDLVDDVITVTEDEIKKATKLVFERAKLVIEPTSGVGIAAITKTDFNKLNGINENVKNVAVILCGGNCDFNLISSWW